MTSISNPGGLGLTEADFRAIMAAVEVEIQARIAEVKSQRAKAATAAKAAKSKRASSKATVPAKYSKGIDQMSNNSETAALIARDLVLQQRARGEGAQFRDVHSRVLKELNANPDATKARYAKLLSKQPARYTARVQQPSGGAPFAYNDVVMRAREIAIARLPPDASTAEISNEIRKIVTELATAAAERQNIADFANANRLTPGGDVAIENYGSLTQKAASIAINRCRKVGGDFQTHYRQAVERLRDELIDSINRNTGT